MLSQMDDYPLHQIADVMRFVGTCDRNFYDRSFLTCMPAASVSGD